MKEVFLPVSTNFSLAACNYMLLLAKENDLGKPINFKCKELQSKQCFPEWWLRCEYGCVISKGV